MEAIIQNIINEFVTEYKKREEVIGLLLTGSYANGTQNNRSDIDIRILFDKNADIYEKRVIKLAGKYFSIIGQSTLKTYKTFYDQLRVFTKFEARVFFKSKILYDKTGEAKHIKDEAKIIIDKPFPEPNQIELKKRLYILWNVKQGLLTHNGYEFALNYYLFLNELLCLYSKMLRTEVCYPIFKLDLYFFNESFRKKFPISEFPDKEFAKKFTESLKAKKTTDRKKFVNILWSFIHSKTDIDFNNYSLNIS